MPRLTLEGNKRNREVLLTYIKNQPFITQDSLMEVTGWSKSYISKLLNWLERDGLIAWRWQYNDLNKARRWRQYVATEAVQS